MSADPLRVTFGGNAALVVCEDQALRQALCQHLRHCLRDTAPEVARYRVTDDDAGSVRVSRDDELLYSGPQSPYLLEYLIQDVTVILTVHCRQHLVFHAAGMASGQSGFLLCGGSGSGKSTLAAWLTASGLDFLSDELVAVSLDLSKMTGLPRSIGLKGGSAFVWERWLNEAARQDLSRLGDDMALIDPELLRPGCVSSSAQPQVLLFPRYAAGEPFAARQLSPAEALFLLMQRLINAQNLPDQALTAATRLARQTTAYSLTYSDVTSAAAWVQQLARPGPS